MSRLGSKRQDVDIKTLSKLPVEQLLIQLSDARESFNIEDVLKKLEDGTVVIKDTTPISNPASAVIDPTSETESPSLGRKEQVILDTAREEMKERGLEASRKYLRRLAGNAIITPKVNEHLLSILTSESVADADRKAEE
jgi:hypothetical protein